MAGAGRSGHQFAWLKIATMLRGWDTRMDAWYVGLAAKTLARATTFVPPTRTDAIGISQDPDQLPPVGLLSGT